MSSPSNSLHLSLSSHSWVTTPGRVDNFFIFRLFKSILFFVNWISLYFFHILWNINKSCLLLLYFHQDSLGCRDFFFSFVPALLLSILVSLITFFCYFVLCHSCCSHARVFGKTLLHEFLISYNHTEWYLFFSDSTTTRAQCVFGAKN